MSTEFRVSPHADFVHVELAADYEIVIAGITELMMSVSDVCSRQGQRRVLIEGKVTLAARRMGTMDSFGAGALAGSMLPGVAVACCFYGYKPDEQTQFFRDVAQNRGVRGDFFTECEVALRWRGVSWQRA